MHLPTSKNIKAEINEKKKLSIQPRGCTIITNFFYKLLCFIICPAYNHKWQHQHFFPRTGYLAAKLYKREPSSYAEKFGRVETYFRHNINSVSTLETFLNFEEISSHFMICKYF